MSYPTMHYQSYERLDSEDTFNSVADKPAKPKSGKARSTPTNLADDIVVLLNNGFQVKGTIFSSDGISYVRYDSDPVIQTGNGFLAQYCGCFSTRAARGGYN